MPGTFTVEYAKSGRSTCKGCQKLIDQGELRIGKMVQSPHFDGEIPLWHHQKCLFKRETITNEALLVGLGNIRPDDVKLLRSKCGGVAAAVSAAAAAGGAGAPNVVILPPSLAGERFQVDYAKSGRSGCKHCGDKIGQDELRVGKMVQSQAFDGMVPNWHHLKCVFKACIIFSHGLVDGLDDLRPEDQKDLKQLISKHSPAGAAAAGLSQDGDGDAAMSKADSKKKSKAKSKKRKNDDSDDESDDNDEAPAKAAKTSTEDYSKMNVDALKAACKEAGLKVTGKKAELVARLEEAAAAAPASSSSAAAATSAASSSSAAAAAVDPVKAAHEAALEVESSARWKLKDSIAHLSTAEIKGLLQCNNQPDKGGPDKLRDQLVDGLMYGALPPCPECGNQSITFKDGQYVCHGHASEWGRCLWKADDIKRAEWDISECDDDWVANFKFKFQKKPLEAHRYVAEQAAKIHQEYKSVAAASEAALAQHQQALVKKQVLEELFADFTICFVGSKFKDAAGKSRTAKELKTLAEEHGAEITTTIDDADLIITTAEDFSANKGKMKKAQEEKKPILLCTFLLASIDKAELAEIKDHAADAAAADQWTGLKDKVESGRQKSGAKLASAAAASSSSTKSVGKSAGGKAKIVIKGRGAVDPDSGLDESGHILEEKDDVWTQTLNTTDLTSGHNSYYVIQLIESDSKGQWWVFRKWGRVGTDRGNHRLSEPYSRKDDAKAEFTTVYLEKTGNNWYDRANFVKRPGKFFPIAIDYSADDSDPLAAAEAASHLKSTSKLDTRIQDLMRVFFDVQAIKKTLVSMEFDLEKMPLGRMSREHIRSAFPVLTSIQNELKGGSPSASKLLALSNQFYTLIPHVFDSGEVQLIDNAELLQSKIEMIETLLEIEIATKLLKEGEKKPENESESTDPIDVHYRQLKTDMKVVEKSTDEFALIKKYIVNTHAPTHKNYTLELMEAFAVDRENEGSRYSKFEEDPNRMLLWHGSRTSNFVGILSQGLRIAPPEAPVTGYMFGKGVYFADMVSKSANYCFTNEANNVGFLLLCEVALGEMNLLKNAQYMDKAPGNCLSTKGEGLTGPDPKEFVKLPNGCVVPAGKPIKTEAASSLLYNEFIVYDVAQIRMKYLLKVKFNYQGRW